jgi:cell division protein FtsI (penicillin-binding protein 3)
MNAALPLATYAARRRIAGLVFATLALSLAWRAFDLQILNQEFLRGQGEARHVRELPIPAWRGPLYDRHGTPLAVSTPVDSVWVNPRVLLNPPAPRKARDHDPQAAAAAAIRQLAAVLEMDATEVRRQLDERAQREFWFLKRHLPPTQAEAVAALKLPGVFLQREYRRYYPAGELAGHVIGFTDVDDTGQEGLERAHETHLRGQAGKRRVVRDRYGEIIGGGEVLEEASPGQPLTLSLDRRIQYLAHRELLAAVQAHKARAGTAVVLDVRSGEVLALVNQPAYNPNARRELTPEFFRNRAVTDLIEPGSTMKPFTVAAALDSGAIRPDLVIDTHPGQMLVGDKVVKDHSNYGRVDLGQLLAKSSNIGSVKIAQAMAPDTHWRLLKALHFGAGTQSGFPGEQGGVLPFYKQWNPVERATLAFGYGLSVTPLQLAQAYAALADDGQWRPVSFLKLEQPPAPERVLSAQTARLVRGFMRGTTQKGGTGTAAAVPGYHVVGKTGTVHKVQAGGGYAKDRYVGFFAGIAPATEPRLAAVVMIDEPGAGQYFGGHVAAPVFGRVMHDALRLLDIPPDDPGSLQHLTQAATPQAEANP